MPPEALWWQGFGFGSAKLPSLKGCGEPCSMENVMPAEDGQADVPGELVDGRARRRPPEFLDLRLLLLSSLCCVCLRVSVGSRAAGRWAAADK